LSEITPPENPEPGTESPDFNFIIIGRIVAPWGARGKVKVQPETDFPDRFSSGEQVFIHGSPLTIADVSWQHGQAILKLSNIDSFEDARRLRGRYLEIPRSRAQPLPAGHYYHFQLIGLEVKTTGGECLGRIKEIITAESNDVYVVHRPEGELLIPAIKDVVKSVDLERGLMEIEAITGLLDLNRKKSD